MSTPGFAAEASLYKTDGHYRLAASYGPQDLVSRVLPSGRTSSEGAHPCPMGEFTVQQCLDQLCCTNNSKDPSVEECVHHVVGADNKDYRCCSDNSTFTQDINIGLPNRCCGGKQTGYTTINDLGNGESCCNGIKCSPYQHCCMGTCQDGKGCGCEPPCTAPKLCCNNACTDTQTDASNCGVCDRQCDPGWICCGGKCIASDNKNCGQCGRICYLESICQNGNCVYDAPSPTVWGHICQKHPEWCWPLPIHLYPYPFPTH
jgi:hypothetical protein